MSHGEGNVITATESFRFLSSNITEAKLNLCAWRGWFERLSHKLLTY